MLLPVCPSAFTALRFYGMRERKGESSAKKSSASAGEVIGGSGGAKKGRMAARGFSVSSRASAVLFQ